MGPHAGCAVHRRASASGIRVGQTHSYAGARLELYPIVARGDNTPRNLVVPRVNYGLVGHDELIGVYTFMATVLYRRKVLERRLDEHVSHRSRQVA